jgi:hypothetical protein
MWLGENAMPVFTHGESDLLEPKYTFIIDEKNINPAFFKWQTDYLYQRCSIYPDDSIVPNFLRLKKKRKLFDIMYIRNTLVVSGRFKNIVESLEPDIHKFIKVQVLICGTAVEDESYYILFVGQTINASVIDKSSIFERPARYGGGTVLYYEMIGEDYRCLRSEFVAGKHLWLDGMFFIFQHLYMSDELFEMYKERKITGMPKFYKANTS